MIMHLSAPTYQNINNGITRDLFSLKYSTINNATKLIAAVGRGTFLATVDIKTAFRLSPVANKTGNFLEFMVGVKPGTPDHLDQQEIH